MNLLSIRISSIKASPVFVAISSVKATSRWPRGAWNKSAAVEKPSRTGRRLVGDRSRRRQLQERDERRRERVTADDGWSSNARQVFHRVASCQVGVQLPHRPGEVNVLAQRPLDLAAGVQ